MENNKYSDKKLAIEKVKQMGVDELKAVNIFISGMEAMKIVNEQKSA